MNQQSKNRLTKTENKLVVTRGEAVTNVTLHGTILQ